MSGSQKDELPNWQVFRLVEVKRQLSAHFYLTRILPVGLFMALTLHFGNIVYLYLTVSFIQMLKVSFRMLWLLLTLACLAHMQRSSGLSMPYCARRGRI